MNQAVWKSLLISPIALGMAAVVATGASAADASAMDEAPDSQILLSQDTGAATPVMDASIDRQTNVAVMPPVEAIAQADMAQVTSVSQLSDVQPTDWAFQALQSLVERYGCIVGYPDGTYRGNRALTRYEFAAGLNACMDRVNELIAAGIADLVTREDLGTLQRLQEEFAAELATLRGRVDALEARTAELEANQFSTTTQLNGEAIFALVGVAAGDNAQGERIDQVTALGSRTRLNFDTSFTGQDLLKTRLQVTNLDSFSARSTLTPEGDLFFAAGPFETGSNNIELDTLLYSFPVGRRTQVAVAANAGASDDFASTVNPYLDGDGGSGALSRFGTRHPIYYYLDGAGIGIQHNLGESLELSAGYLASEANDPAARSGLFNGPYGAIAQVVFKPSERFNLGLTYIHAYRRDTGTGSINSNLVAATDDSPVVTNSYGLQGSFQISPNIVLGGWVGYTAARVINTGDASIWNWAATLSFPDLGRPGNLAGIIVGMEPRLTRVEEGITLATGVEADRDTSLHIEGFYTHQLTDNIAITPGVIWLTAPNHNNANSDVVIGTIRTTFTF